MTTELKETNEGTQDVENAQISHDEPIEVRKRGESHKSLPIENADHVEETRDGQDPVDENQSLMSNVSNIEKVSEDSKTGTIRTFFNIMRGFVGVGFQTLPHLMEQVGWYGILLGFPISGFVVVYGIWMLNKVADSMNYTGGSYENLMKMLFGNWGYNICSCIVVQNQQSTCIANIMFVVNFLDFVFCQHHIEQLCGQKYLFTLYALILSTPIIFITNLKYFSNVSFVAILSIATAMLAILAYDIRSFADKGVFTDNLPEFRPENLPIFFAVMVFSMEGIAMVLPIKNSMKDQSKGSRFMFGITLTVEFIYLIFGLVTALSWGRNTKEIIFHNFGTRYVFIFVIEIIYSTCIFLSYPLNFFPVYKILERTKCSIEYIRKAKPENKTARIWHVKLLTKLFCMLLVFGVCFAAPNFIAFQGLSGAVFNSSLGFFMPAAAYWKHFSNQGTLGIGSKIFTSLYVTVTLTICCIGAYHAIAQMAGSKQVLSNKFQDIESKITTQSKDNSSKLVIQDRVVLYQQEQRLKAH